MGRKKQGKNEISCGTVLYTVEGGEIMFVLVRSFGASSFGFPKGHVEGDESEEETALRETLEECGINAALDQGFRRSETYKLPNGNRKTVTYFAANYKDQMPTIDPAFETGEIRLLSYNDAMKLLRYANVRRILYEANEYIKRKHALDSEKGRADP